MAQSQSERERMWRARKNDQNPHGKVPSLKELGENKETQNRKQK